MTTTSFDLDSVRLDFEHYTFDTASSSDTDSSSVFDCSLDESFRRIKDDLERLHSSTSVPTKKGGYRHRMARDDDDDKPSTPSVVDGDEYPEIDINRRFDVMKDRVRNFRAKETETLRKYIEELNSAIACVVTNSEGKTCAPFFVLFLTGGALGLACVVTTTYPRRPCIFERTV